MAEGILEEGLGLESRTGAISRFRCVANRSMVGDPHVRTPPGEDGPSTSTTRCPCPLAGTGVSGGVESRFRWTSWTSTATGESAFEVSRGAPVSLEMTCGPGVLATGGPGGSVGRGISLTGRGTSVFGPPSGMLGQTVCLLPCRDIRQTWTGRGWTSPRL